MKVLDLFSGIGGFSLGLERAGMETVAFCEFDKHAQKVLKKNWPDVPIFEDVRTLDGRQFKGTVDVVCGGFPCQDISTAGNQEGIGEGTRSGLWSECARLLGEVRPRYAIFENVTSLLNGERGAWFKRVLWDISEVGYDAEWHCISASELGAHHHRDRVWIIAYPNDTAKHSDSRGGSCGETSKERNYVSGLYPDVANAISIRQQGQGQLKQSLFAEAYRKGETVNAFAGGTPEIWKAEPELGRVADGVPNRVDRIKGLGNAVVPQLIQAIGNLVMQADKEMRSGR